MISMAMAAPDDLVAVINYRDEWGRESERVVSPIRFLSAGRFMALCIGRQGVRTFYLGRCTRIRIAPAVDVLAGTHPVKRSNP